MSSHSFKPDLLPTLALLAGWIVGARIPRMVMLCIGLALPLSACNQAQDVSRHLDPYAVLRGSWGWEASDDCKVSPEIMAFDPDHKQLHLTHAPIRDDGTREPRRRITYQVLQEIPGGLRMSLNGEDRTDAAGKLVIWDLMLLDRDTYCWHRNDWRASGCTKAVVRCKN